MSSSVNTVAVLVLLVLLLILPLMLLQQEEELEDAQAQHDELAEEHSKCKRTATCGIGLDFWDPDGE